MADTLSGIRCREKPEHSERRIAADQGTAATPIFTHASDWTRSDNRLAGMFTLFKGGFYHGGRFATLDDYDGCLNLQLSLSEKSDLVQYLLTL
jgi:hypothetical protein